MDRIQDAFGCCEQTFLLMPGQAAALLPLLENRLCLSGPEKRPLCELYYDTDTWAFARAAQEDRPYQERLWLRSDACLRRQGRAQAILRQTLGGRAWQKSAEAGLPELGQRLKGEEPAAKDAIFWQELFWFLRRNRPAPRALVRFDRTKYVGQAEYIGRETGPDHPTLRVVLDEGLCWQKENLAIAALEKDPGGEPLLKEGQAALTVRAEGALPLWLISALSGLSAYPVRFSKLAACWQQCVGAAGPMSRT